MTPSPQDVRVYPATPSLLDAVAQHFVHHARLALEARGSFTVVLAGGSTPKGLYALLAAPPFRAQLDWDTIRFFWGDERHVPPDHRDSNYRMAHDTLLGRVPVAVEHVHRMASELPDAQHAATRYEATLRAQCAVAAANVAASDVPRVDYVLLGMGPDGHTASLFPGTAAVRERRRLVVAPWVDALQAYRITCTPVLFNHARHVTFLVDGHEKARMLHTVLEGPQDPDAFPAQIIQPQSGSLVWFTSRETAVELTRRR